MVFENSILLNGNATSLASWTTENVSRSSVDNIFSGSYFLLEQTAAMRQQINLLRADINTSQRPYRFRAGYFFGPGYDVNTMDTRAYIRLEFNYNDGSIDSFVFPLVEGYTPHVVGNNRWHTITGWAFAKENAILNSITTYIITKEVGARVGITNMELQRSITELEDHNQDPNPHELPLAITVGSFGIKATKGTNVQFWLKDTGDAIFAGQLQAAAGTFAGELVAATGTFKGSLSAATGTFAGDLSAAGGTFRGALSAATGTFAGALSAATGTFAGDLSAAGGTFRGNLSAAGGTFAGNLSAAGGTFSGSLQAASGTFNGTVYAANISTAYGRITTAQIENLVVGSNVTMGSNASISWSNVSGRPNTTYINSSGIYTGSLTADQITAGSISANRIYGGTLSGVTINISTDANIGNWLTLGSNWNGGIRCGAGRLTFDPAGGGAGFSHHLTVPGLSIGGRTVTRQTVGGVSGVLVAN